ncbi:MAG: DUF1476 domain-containing protein [Rhodospirillales bacterium]
MSDAFKDREKGFEAKYKLDQDLAFKAEARRNRLLGEWLAERFGMTSTETVDYAKSVVAADFDEPGVEDVVRKVMADIAERGVDISEADVRSKIEEFNALAAQQVRAEAD